MAAGRYGAYNGFRDRDSESEASEKKENLNNYKDNKDRPSNRESRVRVSSRKEQSAAAETNGAPRSSDSGRSRDRSGTDREPGELSSGASGESDETGVARSSPPVGAKKRKFSPIVWDQEEKQSKAVVPLPPPPPLPEGFVPSSLPEPASVSEVGSPDETRDAVVAEEDFISTRHISASRWADAPDEGEEDLEPRRRSGSSSPELGEVSGDGSGQSGPKSPVSHDDVEEEGQDFMDVDGGSEGDDRSVGTDSEAAHGSPESPEPIKPPQRSIDMLKGCRSVDEFERLNRINEGTYGVVYRARDKKTGEIVALKKVKMEKEREGFPLTSLREINILLSFHHPSIVDVKEVVVGSSLDSIFMVMEYMEHDLKALMETMKQPFSQSEVKCLMLQLLEGAKYLHDNWVLHRDLKTSNLLLNNRGELKICDFGLSRQYGSPLKPYTHLVVTLWYRAPELLLGVKEYSTAIDMWSLGCIMAELLAKEPLFSGKTEIDQLDKIYRILGTPNERIWPGFAKLPKARIQTVKQPYNKLREKFPPTSFSGRPTLSEAGFDLLNKLLTFDPEKRITADAALKHEWFREVPLPKSKDFMPTFPAQNAQDRRVRRVMKSPDPLEELRKKELQQGELGTGGLFG
ncbi:Cyclin-dependent kinase G-2 [Acorus calamus]|uniref:Cyclin-dependent kinase G-2 n=1 Tax=Acorus calamus TaxID=4465 RepID=A0AAV9FLC7_ACOCL|nr:Cyclin-dependent kinase G-2 [Acorus calamus]